MRRFIVVVSLVCAVALVGVTGGVASARPVQAHAAQATIPIIVVKTQERRDGGARPRVHPRPPRPHAGRHGRDGDRDQPTAARHLHLKTVGKPPQVLRRDGLRTGAAGARLELERRRGVPLPTVVVSSAPIAGLNAHAFGLLGSDVLSRFGSVTIDYAAKELILG